MIWSFILLFLLGFCNNRVWIRVMAFILTRSRLDLLANGWNTWATSFTKDVPAEPKGTKKRFGFQKLLSLGMHYLE